MPRPRAKRAEAGKTTNRIDRVNSLIQQLLSAAIMPYVRGMNGIVTVSKVECSGDLRWAKVSITVFGGDDKAVMGTLKNNVYDIQGELNRSLSMKIVPRIIFALDTTARHAEYVSEIFQKIEDEKEKPQQ